MRFFNKYAYMGAIALVGAVGFTACSSEDDLTAQQNPTFDGESVKTQFAINIPYGGGNGTRMSDVNTQENQNFLGMHNINLLPMTSVANDNTSFTSILSLGEITTGGLVASYRKVYSDVNVPVGTTHFLFYGAGGTQDASDMFANGIIDANISGSNTSDLSFSLRGAKGTDADDECGSLIEVLDAVAVVEGWSGQPQGSTLKKLYDNFILLKAGSANSICKTLEALYNSVNSLAVSGTGDEKTIAGKIQEAIKTNNIFTVDGSGPYKLSTKLTYPQNINMPDGAASLSFASGHFTAGQTGVSNSNMTIDMNNICYPASIYYRANTELWATNADNITWPTSLGDWVAGSSFSSWGSSVLATTRTIALKDAIQYAVAKLALTVICSKSSLEDNDGNFISVPNAGFTVTGVLIGGQPESVKWDFTPKGSATNLTKIVYDKDVVTMAAKYETSTPTTKNYTLVLDNKMDQAQTVNIAIELKNTSTSDFKGVDGIVPADGTFYLIGQLDPTGKTVQDVTNPYVFMQDYTTTANLSIASLKNAYNVIPDLRSSQLSLGLAVDLDWKDGIVFNDVVIQ